MTATAVPQLNQKQIRADFAAAAAAAAAEAAKHCIVMRDLSDRAPAAPPGRRYGGARGGTTRRSPASCADAPRPKTNKDPDEPSACQRRSPRVTAGHCRSRRTRATAGRARPPRLRAPCGATAVVLLPPPGDAPAGRDSAAVIPPLSE